MSSQIFLSPRPVAVLAGFLALATATLAQQASLSLSGGGLTIAQTRDTAWQLTKTSQVGPSLATNTGSVQWTVTVDRGDTSSSTLTLLGYLAVRNGGSAPATLGNIVVNLQRKSGRNWISASSAIADATRGDAATTALISSGASSEGRGSFTENAASGTLEFTDLDNNTLFSLAPQTSIPAGAEVRLVFRATFNNSVLAIPTGESVRAEVIVTFGNSGARGGSGASATQLDINGSGAIGADEVYVRSVPSRWTVGVPALVTANAEVLVTDPAVSTTGTVVASSASNGGIDTGALVEADASFTPRVDVDGGTDGGTVTNTAYLDGEDAVISLVIGYTTIANPDGTTTQVAITRDFVIVPAVQLRVASSVSIPGRTVEPPSIGFVTGDFKTFTQGGWGAPPNGNNPAALLAQNFTTVFGSGFTVGVAGNAGYSMTFASSTAVKNYLPAGGTPAALTADLVNPTSSSAGVFGGQVTALRINVAFSLASVNPASFGSLKVIGTGTPLDGLTVLQVLAICESALGGSNTSGATYPQLNEIATNLNEAFDNGNPSSWAQAHLVR